MQALICFESALLIIDPQTRLAEALFDPRPFMLSLDLLHKAAHELKIETFMTLQTPDRLGDSLEFLKVEPSHCFIKRSFNAMQESAIRFQVESHRAKQWVIAGLEAHICVLQTALELQRMGKEVVVLADASASQNLYDYASAISELRAQGIRISSVQTVIYEWMKSCDHPSFQAIVNLVKQHHRSLAAIGHGARAQASRNKNSGCECCQGGSCGCGEASCGEASKGGCGCV